MAVQSSITLPTGLEDVEVIDAREEDGELVLRLQATFPAAVCPTCGRLSSDLNDRRTHQIVVPPLFGRRLTVEVVKRRWKCPNDLCPQATFTEEIKGLRRSCSYVEAFHDFAYSLSRGMTYPDLQRHLQATYKLRPSLSTLYLHCQARLERERGQPMGPRRAEFLGLDEFSKGPSHDFGVILTDLTRREVIEVAEGGKSVRAARQVLQSVDRSAVKACVIDMWRHFKTACQKEIPQAAIVVDRFHVIQYMNKALSVIRNRARREVQGEDRKREIFEIHHLVLMGAEKLSEAQERRLWDGLAYHNDLVKAYEFKELLRAIYAQESPVKAKAQLKRWLEAVAESGIPELDKVREGVASWQLEILNYWTYRITNAVTEGKIHKIKTLRRRAFHYNSFANLRMKILQAE